MNGLSPFFSGLILDELPIDVKSDTEELGVNRGNILLEVLQLLHDLGVKVGLGSFQHLLLFL